MQEGISYTLKKPEDGSAFLETLDLVVLSAWTHPQTEKIPALEPTWMAAHPRRNSQTHVVASLMTSTEASGNEYLVERLQDAEQPLI
ncbi:hypothetical protein FKM82_018351 [Ascaphus truei]